MNVIRANVDTPQLPEPYGAGFANRSFDHGSLL